jgi:hypothetical protein
MMNKGEQVTPAPVHSAWPSGLGPAVGEIENPVRDFTLWAGGTNTTPHQQAEYKVATVFRSLIHPCLQIGRSPYKGQGEGGKKINSFT